MKWTKMLPPVELKFFSGPSIADPCYQIQIMQTVHLINCWSGDDKRVRMFGGWWMKPLARFLCWYFREREPAPKVMFTNVSLPQATIRIKSGVEDEE